MVDDSPQPVVLDTTVLSNFASTGAVEVLVEVLDSPVVVQRDDEPANLSVSVGSILSGGAPRL